MALLARDATGVSGSGTQSQWLMSTYLDQEVLGSMPAPLVAFLEDVAVLGSADVQTLDIARDASDSAAYLAQLETNPAPMVRITDGRRIAVNALLTGHLRRRLRTSNPARVTALLDRAATSLGARHRDAEAFELLVRLGDHARLADFCYRRGAALAMAGRTSTVRRWLSHFTPLMSARTPRSPCSMRSSPAPRGLRRCRAMAGDPVRDGTGLRSRSADAPRCARPRSSPRSAGSNRSVRPPSRR